MINVMLIDCENGQSQTGNIALLDEWQPSTHWLWLDLDSEDPRTESALLTERFGISPLAITDAQRNRHPPKMEVFDDHLFILMIGLDAETTDIFFNTIQLALFVGQNFLITRKSGQSSSIERVWRLAQLKPDMTVNGPAHFAYRISRFMADRYTPVLLQVEERLEQLEEEIFRNPHDSLLEELVVYNARLKKLHRVFTYHQNVMYDVMNTAAKTLRFIDEKAQHEFNDSYEQMERLASLSNLYQELSMDMINGYISLSSHRLNQIMKLLTMVTVIFLPLTLIVGIYGMNFEYIPELRWHFGYFGALGLMLSISVGLLLLFRRLKWF